MAKLHLVVVRIYSMSAAALVYSDFNSYNAIFKDTVCLVKRGGVMQSHIVSHMKPDMGTALAEALEFKINKSRKYCV